MSCDRGHARPRHVREFSTDEFNREKIDSLSFLLYVIDRFFESVGFLQVWFRARLDHFRLDLAPGLESVEIVLPGGEVTPLGDKPKAIPIQFHDDSIEAVFRTARVAWGQSSGKWCWCDDGQTAA